MPARQMHLNAFLAGVGHHEAAWRHPSTDPRLVDDVRYFQELARTAERGTFDSVFLADAVQVWGDVEHSVADTFEALTLLAALAAATERVGLIATASTGFSEPYNVARMFGSLDRISGGRAGWNIVTTAGDRSAQNFNLEANLAHRERYERAAEFVDVARRLWDSWDEDAVVADRATGVYTDARRVREIDHRGRFFRVRGPLNVTRGPQGHPVLVQAGSSDDGRTFAAAYADAVFTAQQVESEARAFAADLRRRAAAAGRDPDAIRVLPGLMTVVGGTEAEALRLARELDELIIPARGLRQLATLIGVDLSDHPLDAPFPELPPASEINSHRSRFELVRDLAARERLTLREVIVRLGGGRGHQVVVGAPEQVAARMLGWFRSGAADGFNVMPALLPGGLTDFVDHVVPELRRLGVFRTEYAGATLRAHYGLPRPAAAAAPAQ